VSLGKIYTATILDHRKEQDFYLNLYINRSQKARVHLSELGDSVFQNGQNLLDLPTFAPNGQINVKVIEFRYGLAHDFYTETLKSLAMYVVIGKRIEKSASQNARQERQS